MSTLAAILRRLDALEARLAAPATVDRSAEQVMAQINLIAERMRAAPDWKEPPPDPSGSRLSKLIEACRAAKAAAERH
jgi:hypothetical protein